MKYGFSSGYWTVVDERQSNLIVAEITVLSTGEFCIEFKSRYDIFENIGLLNPGRFPSLSDVKAYLDKLPTIQEFEATICKLFKVAKESEGVSGWHQNGDDAAWSDLINTDHLYM